ncbi:MAG: hypothetical protein GXP54_09010, partial [Deltaproteobacteria bacterium]|nr:hypothetical protein [Deltaproteobacteria bacterium]
MNTRLSVVSRCFVALLGLFAFACGGGGGEDNSNPPLDIPEMPDIIYVDNVEDAAEVQGEVPGGEDVVGDVFDAQDVKPPEKCEKDEHCIGKVTLGPCQDPSCDTDTGECGWKWKECCDQVFINEGFENGMPEGWTVEDANQDDFVTWGVSDHRHAFGANSMYAGNPKCHTYFNGPLDQDCQQTGPGGSKVVRLSLLTPQIDFPDTNGTLVAEFYVWMETEPLIDGIEITNQPDRLTVTAEVGDQDLELFPNLDVRKTTNGVFMFVTTSLQGLKGKSVRLRFKFDTLDGNNNEYEGVYIDNVRVFSSCGLTTCDKGDKCAGDQEECTDDNCSVYWDGDSGYCGYPEIPTCVEPMCTPENVDSKCLDAKDCEEATCVDGACVYTEIPDCCKTYMKLDADFDDGSLDGFNVYSYQSNAKVKWQVSTYKSVSPQYSLYYGNTVSHTYETDGPFNFGEATSQVVMLESGYAFLTFNLYLSTEFDNTDPAKYYNPLGIDFFEVQVVENVGSVDPETVTQVWSGHNIQGTTGGVFIPVGIDLTPWAGKNIWLRFRFDTSDNVDNAYEGPYVDDVKIEYATPTCGDEYVGRNCQGDYDCGIDGVCKTGACVNNKCEVQVIGTPPDCCSTQTECEDGDACTADGCIDHKCVYSPVEGPGCCKPDTLALFDFDLGVLSGFSVVDDGTDVKWQTTDAQFKSSPSALYFGNGVNYDNGGVASGSALSPSVSIPVGGNFDLSFSLFLDVDSNAIFDLFKVEVVADDMTPTLV